MNKSSISVQLFAHFLIDCHWLVLVLVVVTEVSSDDPQGDVVKYE